jgi:hypothetical protein
MIENECIRDLWIYSTTPTTTTTPSSAQVDTTTSDIPAVLDMPFGRIFLGYPVVPYVDPAVEAVAQAEAKEAGQTKVGRG